MTWRYRIVLLFFAFIFLLVVLRLFYWQVVRAEELSRIGQEQYTRQITEPAKRGEIKTSDGFPIAANKLAFLVYANPKEVPDKEKNAMLLAPILGEETATISGLLSLDKFWVALKPSIDDNT